MNKTQETVEPFQINKTDKIRINLEKLNLKKYNELNSDDLSINIISNAYLNSTFRINDKKLEELFFSMLPEITIFEKKEIYYFYNIEKDLTQEISSTNLNKVFKLN